MNSFLHQRERYYPHFYLKYPPILESPAEEGDIIDFISFLSSVFSRYRIL